MLNEIQLSHYGQLSIKSSPVSRMMVSFAVDFRDDSDINLGVGYVNEKNIPRDFIQEAQENVLLNPKKYRAALNYGGPKGSNNLKHSLRRFLIENPGNGIDENLLSGKEIIIGANGATSLLEGLTQVLRKGIVITADPVYYIYCHFLERIGFQIMAIPEDEQGIRIDILKEKVASLGDKKHDIIFFDIVTVNNPSCTILSNKRRQELITYATELSYHLGRKIPVILDKAYEGLVHDPNVSELKSGFVYDAHNIVYEIGTLSKILAPGLRIGYMIGENNDFLRGMIQRVSDVGFSAALVNQEIASYMLDHHGADQVKKVNAEYKLKATQIKIWLHEFLGIYLENYTGGQAGFYYYLTFRTIETHDQSLFFNYLARTTGNLDIDGPDNRKHPRIIYIPGTYCVHNSGDLVEIGKRQLRLSYGFEDLKNIHSAIKYMKEACEYVMNAG